MQTCADSAFCTRLRNAPGPGFAIDPTSVSVSGAHVVAHLASPAAPGATLILRLISMGGIVRLHINELDGTRFEVPGILVPSASASQQEWTIVSQSSSALQLRTSSGATASLNFSPVALSVTASDGTHVLTWNADGHFAFEHTRTKQENDPAGWWEETFNGHVDSKPRGPNAIGFDVLLHDTQHVFGLPERATQFSLAPTIDDNGTVSEPYRLYNLDVFEHLSNSPFGLYGSIPYLIGHRSGQTTGVFWLNAAEMYVDVVKSVAGTSTRWIAESGVLDLFFLLGPSPPEVARQYHVLTGGTAMPQLFSLGHHQCRWNYKDEADIAAVDAGFEEHALPYDVLWLDIEHTDGKRYFTWDKAYFPNPIAMQSDLASRGRKMVTIVDPHIKSDPNYRVFKEAEEKQLFVKTKDGADFKGHCWPGESAYLDMLNPTVRDWWADQFSTSVYEGSTTDLYIWNDMNEPSVFNGPEITMPKDARHVQGVEHRDLHNANGLFYHMATASGLRRRGYKEVDTVSGDRPFVLSRAFFSGTQRVGPIWTGDNAAEWAHLEVSIPMLLSLNVAGLPFSGADVGGFFGNPEPELLVRWYQVAAFYPFFRAHAHIETKRREPWLFGEETTGRIRSALQQRRRGYKEVDTVSGDRPFVLSRAFFSGTQRVGPIWTGDNAAEWAHLEVSIPMLLSLNVAGLPFSGADVGGFFGNPEPELLVRWYQVAAFYPFFRAHAHIETKRREPWLFGEETTGRIRSALQQRYRILPQLYTLFLHANATGAPIMRPLWWEFPGDALIYAVHNAFMLGDSQLVVPVLRQGANDTVVVLPGDGLWYDGTMGLQLDAAAPGRKLFRVATSLDAPVQTYLRGGSTLVLRERPRRSTRAMAKDPLTLVVALDRSGGARGDLYMDDGRSYAYQAGEFVYAQITMKGGVLEWGPGDHAQMGLPPPAPGYDPEVYVDRVVVLGLEGGPQDWSAVAVAGAVGPRVALDAAPGPVQVASEGPSLALVVRRPHLPVRGTWSIEFRSERASS
ncbi:Neutral alpha-glucosidase AB [Auxenochlorella protothecoides]|uniref:Glucosidase II subunit alpha n=1 Tax=Auxenochlorella protothecoides TaxID=3075 RepID=A0A087SIJ3_AUXPR|nr:Neutral alpha-glucosidase AB [Auxenochlorella protothecoides]KFM25547.1 Neutral alpha-glucosidase AB [Auxenochlorella protothecoides]